MNKIFAVTTAILLVSAGAVLLRQKVQSQTATGEDLSGRVLLAGDALPSVRLITLERGEQILQLERTESGLWLVSARSKDSTIPSSDAAGTANAAARTESTSFPADAARVSRLLQTLSETKFERVVSRDPSQLPALGLDEASQPGRLTLLLQAARTEILLGKPRPAGGQYVKPINGIHSETRGEERLAEPVYLTTRALSELSGTDRGTWELKTVLSVSTMDLEELAVSLPEHPEREWVWKRDGDKWTFQGKPEGEWNLSAFDGLKGRFSNLRATGRLPAKASQGAEGADVRREGSSDAEKGTERRRVRVHSKSGGVWVFLVSRPDPHVNAQAENETRKVILTFDEIRDPGADPVLAGALKSSRFEMPEGSLAAVFEDFDTTMARP